MGSTAGSGLVDIPLQSGAGGADAVAAAQRVGWGPDVRAMRGLAWLLPEGVHWLAHL